MKGEIPIAIKAGQLLHTSGSVVIDRLQTAGPGLNIPTEKINELGNYNSVATIRDIPDLTFNMESFDVSCEMEGLICGGVSPFDLTALRVVDVASHFKAGQTAATPYLIVNSVGVPQLQPESVAYRFGLRDNARQTTTLRGDSIYYSPGSTYIETATGTNTASQAVAFTNAPALAYNGDGFLRYALNVSVDGIRLTPGSDYTETAAGITVIAAVPVTSTIRVVYASGTMATFDATVHEGASIKPAAIRGRDIDVYIGGTAASARWNSVQAVTAELRATLDKDEEFGNYHAVSQDYPTPAVTGTIEVKPRNPDELLAKIREVASVTATNEVVGPMTSQPLPLWVVLKRPADDAGGLFGSPIKVLYIDDARFTVPGYNAQVQQKLTFTLNWESDQGHFKVFDPGAAGYTGPTYP